MKIRNIIIFFLFVFNLYSQVWFPAINGKKFLFYHFNDIHGSIGVSEAWWINPDFPPKLSGGLGAAYLIKKQRDWALKNNIGFMVLDSGDWFQGTLIGNLSKGKAVVDYFNLVGVDLTTIGNHDFDFGQEALKEFIKYGNFITLSANLVYRESGEVVNYAKPYYIWQINGIKIGFFGLTTPTLRWVTLLENVMDIDALKVFDVAREYVAKLKKEGADIICVLSHLGYDSDIKLATQVEGIDIIFGGHSHTGMDKAYINPYNHTFVVQNYGSLSCIQEVKFIVDENSKKIQWIDHKLIDLFEDRYKSDKEALKLYNKNYQKYVANMDEVIGITTENIERSPRFGSGPMGNLCADVIREITKSDVAFFSGERGSLKKGKITYSDIFKCLPFDNTIVYMSLTGEQIRYVCEYSVNGYHAAYQVSGLKMSFDMSKPQYNRVKEIFINGKPLEPEKIYKVGTINYLAQRSCFIPGKGIKNTGILVRDAVIEFIKKNSPITPDYEARLINISE